MPEVDHADDDAAGDHPTDERAGDDAEDARDVRADAAHLDEVDDGCGCTEIWEHLSDQRADD